MIVKRIAWVGSPECRSGKHCVMCRGTSEHWQAIRQRFTTAFTFPPAPEGKELFCCPDGLPLNVTLITVQGHQQIRSMEGRGWSGEDDGGCGCSPPTPALPT